MTKSSRSFLAILPYFHGDTASAALEQLVLTAPNHSVASGLAVAVARDRRAWLRVRGYDDEDIERELRGEMEWPEDCPDPRHIRILEITELSSRPGENQRLHASLEWPIRAPETHGRDGRDQHARRDSPGSTNRYLALVPFVPNTPNNRKN
jgi:hypothetical protein